MNFDELDNPSGKEITLTIMLVVGIMIFIPVIQMYKQVVVPIIIGVALAVFYLIMRINLKGIGEVKQEMEKMGSSAGGVVEKTLFGLKLSSPNFTIKYHIRSKNSPAGFHIIFNRECNVRASNFFGGPSVKVTDLPEDAAEKKKMEVERFLRISESEGFKVDRIKKKKDTTYIHLQSGPYDSKDLIEFLKKLETNLFS